MSLMRWNPWDELGRLREEVNRLMESAPVPGWLRGNWQPAVDVIEGEKEIVIKAELPGFDPKDVEVRVFPDSVTLKSEVVREAETERAGYYHRERHYGGFFRQIRLPVPVQAESARATFRHGLLELRIPKADDAAGQGHRVAIQQE